MARLTVRWELAESSGQPGLRVFVDGEDLKDLVRRVELPAAERERHPGIAGSYAGLAAWRLRRKVVEHFLGAPESHLACGPHDKTVLLGCTCGEPGCWPLMARVEVSSTEVRWKDFEQPHRRGSWSHEALGPILFDRGPYERALEEAELSVPPDAPTHPGLA